MSLGFEDLFAVAKPEQQLLRLCQEHESRHLFSLQAGSKYCAWTLIPFRCQAPLVTLLLR